MKSAPSHDVERWVRYSLWLTAPFNFLAAYAFAFPTSALGQLLALPQQPYSFYTVFAGGMVGLFGGMYVWAALQTHLVRPIIAFGATGKTIAVATSALLFAVGKFSGFALFVVSGDLVFAALWFYWLTRTRRDRV